jgi:hypothetical protein
MRKYLLLICVLGLAMQSFAQDKKVEQKNGAVITWEKKTHDFGTIVQGDKVEHTFYFTNTGNEPLIITNVQVSCGCTTPKGWPRDPIPPKGSGEITVSFNSAGKMGIQNKPVTMVTNAVNPEGNTITFTTNVIDKKPNQ